MTHSWRGQGVCLTGNPSAATDLSLVGLVCTGGHCILLAEHPVFRDLLFGFSPFAVVLFIFFLLWREGQIFLVSSSPRWVLAISWLLLCFSMWPFTGSCCFLAVFSGRRFSGTAFYPHCRLRLLSDCFGVLSLRCISYVVHLIYFGKIENKKF